MDDKVSIQINENFLTIINPLRVRDAVNQTINYAATSNQVSLTVVFENDEKLHQLNNQYLGIDAPTDVLAFPADYVDPETGNRYLGDILISVPRALEQATSGNHPLNDELQLLVVHGVLHLLGYDHVVNNEKERMQTAQSAILLRLGSELKVNL
jgi:probable rRNA maturation factor